MKIVEYIEENTQEINEFLQSCNFFLVLNEDKVIFHLEFDPPERKIDMEGVASLVHTINLFAGKQDYDSYRRVDFKQMSITFNRYQNYTIAFGLKKNIEEEKYNALKKVISLLFSIFYEVTSLSKPVTELEIAGAMVSILFVVTGRIGDVCYSSFDKDDLIDYTDKLLETINESEYKEFKQFKISEFNEGVTIESFLDEIRKDINEVNAVGFYSIEEDGQMKLAKAGMLDEEVEKKIVDTILSESHIFHKLFEGHRYVSIDLDEKFITFIQLSSFTGIYLVGDERKEKGDCAESIEHFIELMKIFFPEYIGEV